MSEDELQEGLIDLRALIDEARRQWWIDSGQQAVFDEMLYRAFRNAKERYERM